MQIKDLSVDELRALIRETVAETIEDYLEDRDRDLDLKPDVIERLQRARTRSPQERISAAEAARQLGLDEA